ACPQQLRRRRAHDRGGRAVRPGAIDPLSLKLLAQATSLYGSLSQQWSSSGDLRRLSDSLFRMAGHAGISQERLRGEIATRAAQLGSWAVGMVGWAASGVAQQSVTTVLSFFILFFLLRDWQKFRAAVSDLLPLPPGRFEELAAIVHKSIVNNIYGTFAIGVTQGILTALGFWVTGLPTQSLWGVVAMIFSFVPLVGPIQVWLPGAMVLALYADWGKAILLFLWGAVLVSGADYLIRAQFAGVGQRREQAAGPAVFLRRHKSVRRHRNLFRSCHAIARY